MRGFAIILRVRRERKRETEEKGEVGGQLWWLLEVALLKMRGGEGERLRWERIGDGAAKLVDVWRAGQMPNEQRRKEERRERQAGLSLSLKILCPAPSHWPAKNGHLLSPSELASCVQTVSGRPAGWHP